MRHYISRFVLLAAIVASFMLGGCSGTPGNVTRIAFVSADIKPDGLTISKGAGTLIGVQAYDGNGNVVDVPAAVFAWSSDNDNIFTAMTLGSAALVSGKVDWFDTVSQPDTNSGGTANSGDATYSALPAVQTGTPYEPKALLTVTYGDSSPAQKISVSVSVVISAAGRWHVSVPGLIEQDLTLEQNGRLVSYQGASTSASGSIDGNQFTLEQQGFVLTGTLTTPTDVNGTYTGPGGLAGDWNAHKLD